MRIQTTTTRMRSGGRRGEDRVRCRHGRPDSGLSKVFPDRKGKGQAPGRRSMDGGIIKVDPGKFPGGVSASRGSEADGVACLSVTESVCPRWVAS